jgi:hypothetical protein
MGRKIKVRCNGRQRCVNEVDLDEVLCLQPVLKGPDAWCELSGNQRIVLGCRFCSEGKVIVDSDMIRRFRESGL